MKALVVIDMQNDFCQPDGKLYGGDRVRRVIEPIRKVIEEFRSRGYRIIYTQDWHRKDDPEFRIWPPHCIENTWGAEIINELSPEDDYVVRKRRYTAFFGTDLDMYLRENGIQELYLSGVLTNICVLHTASDAVLRGYSVTVIGDCTEALSMEDYDYAIKHMKNILNCKIENTGELEL